MMATDEAQIPFVKQLAAGDRPTREKALTSLQTYLCSGREFTSLDLLKIWKGLFYCMHHTDRPAPQAAIARSLSALLLALPTHLFIPFLNAFWSTMISYYSDIPSLRLDKYLYLVRLYVSSSFQYLSRHEWNKELLGGWSALMEGAGEGLGDQGASVLDVGDIKVPDGLRYHVIEVWVDGIMDCANWDAGKESLLRPVEKVAKEGKSKVLRTRANAALDDPRLTENADSMAGEDDKFEGFESE